MILNFLLRFKATLEYFNINDNNINNEILKSKIQE